MRSFADSRKRLIPFNVLIDTRQQFSEDLGAVFRRTSCNGPKFVFGDLNSRILRQVPGEEDFFGEFVLGPSSCELQFGPIENCFGSSVWNTV